MSRPLVSVVLASYQRRHLLERSLYCYQTQAFPPEELELVVVDDHSTDGTRDLVMDWAKGTGIRATVLTPGPKDRAWRDCGAVLNHGIRAAAGDYVLLTHPEVMPGRRSVAACVDALRQFEFKGGCEPPVNRYDLPPRLVEKFEAGYMPPAESTEEIHQIEWHLHCLWANKVLSPFGLYACCRPYYLTAQDQLSIDRVDWPGEGPLAVRKIDKFYDERQHMFGHPDYGPRVIEQVGQPGFRLPTWESWVFGGCSRATWKKLGGMLETQMWGSVDVAFTHRRKALGIPNHTCPGDDTICVHQNHDNPDLNVQTPRVEEGWRRELAPLVDNKTAAELAWPLIDYLGW